MLSYVANHSKQRKSTKVIEVQWIASIWCQNDKICWVTSQTIPNTAKLQKWSNYDELDRFDVKTIKNVELRPKPFQTTQTYKSNQITMNCIDLMSKTSNNAKLQKWSNYDELHRFDVKTIKNVELRPKPFKTTQTYKSNQIAMNWIDLMSKTSNNAKLQKWSNYDEVHGLDVKTNKNVELRRKPFKTTQIYKGYQSTMNCIDLMSKTSNNAKLQKWSIYDELDRFDVKTIKNVELRPKPFQTTQTYKSNQITMNCIDLMSETSNNAKLQKWSNYDELHRFDVKTIKNVELRPKPFKTTQTYKSNQIAMNWIDLMSKTSNNAKLQKWSNYDEVHGLDVKTNKNVELRRKPFKTTQIYKGYQSTMNCIDLMSKTSNNAKLQKWSIYDELDRFDVKTIKNVELRPKPFQTTQTYKSNQITMNCIDLMSETSNNAKLQKWSNYDELHRFDVKTIKNVELRPKPFKTTQTYKSNQIAMNWIDLMSKTSNNAKLQKWSNYDEVHGLDVKTNKNVELRRKPFKTTQIYKGYQSTMNCIDLMSKTSNNAKLQKWSNYDELHGFDVKTNKNVELRPKPFETTQIYKIYQSTMNCIDLMSKTSNNAKLQKWSNYDELHRFDVKTIKNVELRPKPFKTTQTYKSNQIAMNWIDLMSKTSNNAKLQKWSNYDEVHGLDVKTNKNFELRRKPFKTTQIYKGYRSTMNCIDLMSKR